VQATPEADQNGGEVCVSLSLSFTLSFYLFLALSRSLSLFSVRVLIKPD
jgi:hypothetical protein